MSISEGDPLGGGPDEGFSPPVPDAPDTYGYGSGPVPPGATLVREPFDLGRYQLAAWSQRLVAWLIDAAVIFVLWLAIFIPVGIIGGAADSTGGIIGTVLVGLFSAAVLLVATMLYAPILMTRWNGQTLGKRAAGIRVIRTNAEPMDFGTAFVRESLVKGLLIAFVGFVTFALVPLIDYLWPLWDAENRALHDFICSTRVVRS